MTGRMHPDHRTIHPRAARELVPHLPNRAPELPTGSDADLREALAVMCDRLQAHSVRLTMPDGTTFVHRRFCGVPTQHNVTAKNEIAGHVASARGEPGTGSGLVLELHLPADTWHPSRQEDLEQAAHWVRSRVPTSPETGDPAAASVADSRCATVNLVRRFDHEARSPLQAILGFAQLLQRSADKPEQRRRLRLIEDAARQLTALLDELSAHLYTAKQQGPLTEHLDLTSLVGTAVALVEPLATERDLSLDVTTTGPITVRAVRHHTVQILLNLLTNAVKYTYPGDTIKVAVGRHGHHATVAVQDHGPGLSPSALKRLFEPLYRVRQGSSRDIPGRGLGLSICQMLAQQMNADIEVDSALGQGATFKFRIPLIVP